MASPAYASQTPNTYTYYAWPPGPALTSIDFTTTVTDDPGYTANVFWSNQFDFAGGNTGYTGMQDNGGQARLFLFSVWKAIDAKPGSPGSYCKDFDENGPAKTCRMRFDWKPGHAMRFHVAHEGGGWFGVTVTDLTVHISFKLGSIRTNSTRFSSDNMSSWTEYFEWSYDNPTCFNQPYARAIIALPLGNEGRTTASIASTQASGDSQEPGACRSHVTRTATGSIQADALGNSFRGPVVAGNGLCLNTFGEAALDAQATTYACNGQANQVWVLGANGAMQLAYNDGTKLLASALCLEAGSGAHALVTIKSCEAHPGQRWMYRSGQIFSTINTCLTSRVPGEQLTIEPCTGAAIQRWRVPMPRAANTVG